MNTNIPKVRRKAMPFLASALILTLLGVGVVSAAPCGGQNAAPILINTTIGSGNLTYTVVVTTPFSEQPVDLFVSQQIGSNATTNATAYSSYNRYDNTSGYYSLFYLTGVRAANRNTVVSDTIPASPLCGSPSVTIADAVLKDPVPMSAIVNSTNITLGQSITGEPLAQIPKQYQTINYTSGSTFIQSTYCRNLIVENGTTTPVEQTNLTLVHGNYSALIDYVPTSVGKYAVGIQCIYQNDTYVDGSWQGWTNALQVVNESAAINVAYPQSTAPPPPPASSTWNVLLADFLKALEMLF